MSASTLIPPATPAAPASPTSGPGAAGHWREWRTPLAIIVFVLLAGSAVALLQPSPAVTGYLSPASTKADGTRALADILAERGHPVQAATTVRAATRAASADTTLVITSPYRLSRRDLLALARVPAGLVIVEPDQPTLDALAPGVTLAGGAPAGALLPGCSLPAAAVAGSADLGGPGLRIGPGSPAAAQCYIANGLPTLVRFRAGGRLITVLSTGDPLSNGYLGREGNAALSINLLSTGGKVIWLVPPAASPVAAGGTTSVASLVPLAAYLVAIQLGLALLLAAAWRARRLGPLITERLPVVVRASETVEGHARLYRSRRARDRVAAALRTAAIARLLPALGLQQGVPPAAVTAALAARSTLDQAAVADLLYGPVPGSDTALIRLAGDLDALEGEVRSS
jgi:hypothetical protein